MAVTNTITTTTIEPAVYTLVLRRPQAPEDPLTLVIRQLIELLQAKNTEALHYEQLIQRDAEKRTARDLQDAARLRGMAGAIEAERARSAEEHQRHLEGSLRQLEAVMAMRERFLQGVLGDWRAQATTLAAELATSRAASANYEQQIMNLQRTLQGLGR